MKTVELELSVEEVNVILEALGAQPFARVYGLIGRIQEQARQQLAQAAEAEGGVPGRGNGAAERAEPNA
jgi:hypothetical protein